ncbi:hypothetical protein [Spirillospora sp. NPDC029432]|uniref:hypothetical protein n=1 Tax=Spirillospora sp. NPDC029432 TaxID=3154599 RepID=UPI003453897D
MLDAQEILRRIDAAYDLEPERAGADHGAFFAEMADCLAHAEALGDPGVLMYARLGYGSALRWRPGVGARETTRTWLGLLRTCLLAWHAEPGRYDAICVRALWCQLLDLLGFYVELYPEPADRVLRLADELGRYDPRTLPFVPYELDMIRMRVAARRGDAAEAERIWRSLRAREFPDDRLLHDRILAADAEMWTWLGRYDLAVESLAPVVAGQVPLTDGLPVEQRLLVPYVRLGRIDEAVAIHERTWDLPEQKLDPILAQLEFCLLTGNEERGLQVLHRNLRRIRNRTSGSLHGTAVAAVGAALCRRVLARGMDREWLWDCGCDGPACEDNPLYTYAALERDLYWDAVDAAEELDEPDGVTAEFDRVRERLALEPVAHVELPSRPAVPPAFPHPVTHLPATGAAELAAALDAATAEPLGRRRIALLQQITVNATLADLPQTVGAARTAMLDDLTRDGWDGWRFELARDLLELFRLHDADPSLLGAERLDRMWRAVPTALDRVLDRPGLHLAQVYELLGLLERHRRPGTGDEHHLRWYRAAFRTRGGDRDGAAKAWAAFDALPPHDRYNAEGQVRRRVRWHLDLGDDAAALAAGPDGCDLLLVPYLRAGRAGLARSVHERTRETASSAAAVTEHLRYCAATGALDDALGVVQRNLRLYHLRYDDDEATFDHLRAHAAAVLVCEAVVAAGRDTVWTWPEDECDPPCPPEDDWTYTRFAGNTRPSLLARARRWESLLGTGAHTRAVFALADGDRAEPSGDPLRPTV